MSMPVPTRLTRPGARTAWVFPLLLPLLLSVWATAQIGQPPDSVVAALDGYQLVAADDGSYLAADDFRVDIELRRGVIYRVAGSGALTNGNIAFAADLIGAATGFGDGIAEPVATFFATRVGEFSGQGPVALGLEQYLLELEVTGAEPYRVSFRLALQEVPEGAFPESRHALGPADARFVIREFSDFQCPFCARFATAGLPALKAELLARGDVRFEYHHFPLISIHPNAVPAAEASECVAALVGEDAFWAFHDALFARQQAWAELADPNPFFLELAVELGGEQEALADCLAERSYAELVADAFAVASGPLRLSGTPSLFVNSYKVSNYLDVQSYLDLMELIEAFSGEQ